MKFNYIRKLINIRRIITIFIIFQNNDNLLELRYYKYINNI